MNHFEELRGERLNKPMRWLVTGVAGFIGSHLLEALLKWNQKVVGLDNFSTGYEANLMAVKNTVQPSQWDQFEFYEGDICDETTCLQVTEQVDFVLHHAALGSVPLSLEAPLKTHQTNATGFMNILEGCRHSDAVRKVVYASSSAVYGDSAQLPHQEDVIGTPLSPYATSKWINEKSAQTYAQVYGLSSVGLRYFNVFGPRQDPNGAYAAVIPKWLQRLQDEKPVVIHGDGQTTRDFCFVENVVQANILSAITNTPSTASAVYNIGTGAETSLLELADLMQKRVLGHGMELQPIHEQERDGDIRNSVADITRVKKSLGFQPLVDLPTGLEKMVQTEVGAQPGDRDPKMTT